MIFDERNYIENEKFAISYSFFLEDFNMKHEKVIQYRLIVGTLFHNFAMSAIKWHFGFVDCSLIYADFQRLFVFKTFEFGTIFGPRWFCLDF